MRTVKLRLVPGFFLAIAQLSAAASTAAPPASWGGDPLAPIVAPFPMPQLARPQFPAHAVDIREHGADAGGGQKTPRRSPPPSRTTPAAASCRNVLVEHCVFDPGDDCLVLKSGYNEDGGRVARPTENVVRRWCSSQRGHGGLVIGSEMSGDVRNVYMHDCDFAGTDRAVRIKARRDRGGVVEHGTAERLRVRHMPQDVVIMNMDYTADRNQPIATKPPVFRDLHFKDVTADGAPVAIRLTGLADSPIENISFENLTLTATRGVKLRHVKNVTFKNVVVTAQTGPAIELVDARGVRVDGVPLKP